ncbi:MAG: hypothetical protein ACAI44_11125 [Candidatus Sericytochromatia bacterium]
MDQIQFPSTPQAAQQAPKPAKGEQAATAKAHAAADPVAPLIKRLAPLNDTDRSWLLDRWNDSLEKQKPEVASQLVDALLERIDALETQPGGVPQAKAEDYRLLMDMYNSFTLVKDKLRVGPMLQGSASPKVSIP